MQEQCFPADETAFLKRAIARSAVQGAFTGGLEVAEKVLKRRGYNETLSKSIVEVSYVLSYAAFSFWDHYSSSSAAGEGENAAYKALGDTCYDILNLIALRVTLSGTAKGFEQAASYAQNAGLEKSASWLRFFGQHVSKGMYIQNALAEGVEDPMGIGLTVATGAAVEEVIKYTGEHILSLTPQKRM